MVIARKDRRYPVLQCINDTSNLTVKGSSTGEENHKEVMRLVMQVWKNDEFGKDIGMARMSIKTYRKRESNRNRKKDQQ